MKELDEYTNAFDNREEAKRRYDEAEKIWLKLHNDAFLKLKLLIATSLPSHNNHYVFLGGITFNRTDVSVVLNLVNKQTCEFDMDYKGSIPLDVLFNAAKNLSVSDKYTGKLYSDRTFTPDEVVGTSDLDLTKYLTLVKKTIATSVANKVLSVSQLTNHMYDLILGSKL